MNDYFNVILFIYNIFILREIKIQGKYKKNKLYLLMNQKYLSYVNNVMENIVFLYNKQTKKYEKINEKK